jgi:predicted transcriptional regulator
MGSHTDKTELRSEFVATRLRPSERRELDDLAVELDRPVSSLVRDAVRAYLARFRADTKESK